jgi:hypothetical protein
MQNKNSIVKELFYSAWLALVPALVSVVLYDLTKNLEPTPLGFCLKLLFSLLIITFIIFAIRQKLSKNVLRIIGIIFLVSIFSLVIFISSMKEIICRKLGGTNSRVSMTGVLDINGEFHPPSSTRRDFGITHVCYVTSEQLQKINPEAPFYKYVDFVIKD